jgi:hypothetical protein
MKTTYLLKKIKMSISIVLVVSMLWISFPHAYVSAAIIGTETVANSLRGQQARSHIQSVLARAEVQTMLTGQGVNLEEAANRISSLTDAEAIRLAAEMDKLPAGGDGFSALVIASLIVFLVLLITDIVGYTDIFPFVKKVR